MDNVINNSSTIPNNNTTNVNENQYGDTTTVNSNWVWSDEKLSYYDQSTGWYYREDLGYFYFDENNECHYIYPAEMSTATTNFDNNDKEEADDLNIKHHSHHKHHSKKPKNSEDTVNENKHDKEEEKEDSKENNDSKNDSESEWEEGEISDDEEESITKDNNNNPNSSTYLQQQPAMYMMNESYYPTTTTTITNNGTDYYSNLNGMGISGPNSSTAATYTTDIQLTYGIDPNQNAGLVPTTTIEGQPTAQDYENEYLRLVVKSSDIYEKGSIILIDAEGLSIGRDKSYEKRLRLPEMQVSKYHAKIYLEAEYQQIIPPQTEQPSTLESAISLPADQPNPYLKSKKSSHPKRKYEDFDQDFVDNERDITYDYKMYDDDDDDDDDKHDKKDYNKDDDKDSQPINKKLKKSDKSETKMELDEKQEKEKFKEKEKEGKEEKEENENITNKNDQNIKDESLKSKETNEKEKEEKKKKKKKKKRRKGRRKDR